MTLGDCTNCTFPPQKIVVKKTTSSEGFCSSAFGWLWPGCWSSGGGEPCEEECQKRVAEEHRKAAERARQENERLERELEEDVRESGAATDEAPKGDPFRRWLTDLMKGDDFEKNLEQMKRDPQMQPLPGGPMKELTGEIVERAPKASWNALNFWTGMSPGRGAPTTRKPPQLKKQPKQLMPRPPKPAAPPPPPGKSLSEFGELMKWGRGDAAARNAIRSLDPSKLRDAGLTSSLAQRWANFYRGIKANNPKNPSAQGRSELMDAAADALKAVE